MVNVIRLLFTIVFGFLWWWTWNFAGPALQPLFVLCSILTLCVCCCTDKDPQTEWSFDRYFACLRRCSPALLVLMIALFLLGIFAVWFATGAVPAGAIMLRILVAAVGSVAFVRVICCAYQA